MKNRNETIEINILGRIYPVKCTSEEIEELKNAEKALNTQLKQYMLTYDQIDGQDCLSMALIQNQLSPERSEQFELETKIHKKLDRIDQVIGSELSS